VLIFPESKINLTDELLEFKDGAAAMAYRANVPIYPIYVYPKRQALHVQHIMIGKPIHLHKEFDKLDQNTVKVMTKKLYDYVHLMKEKLEKELA
jgi:1-acyl-sn-glycerol-3-phosphate acyltransferase